ncbi:MAG: PP2C family serine/threonine-protein phosphatase [Sandaracinaceae bacterium]
MNGPITLGSTNVWTPSALSWGEVAVLSWPRSEAGVNEDAAVVCERENALMLAVADGVGGIPGGDRASRKALETLAARFLDGERIEDAIERANEAVRELRGPASTLVACTVEEGILRTFHVGDSQAILLGGRGRIKGLTMPHSVVGHAQEAGLLDPEEAVGHPESNIVTNVLGDPVLRVERTHWGRLAQRDTLLLASDGLFDALDTESIASKGPRGRLYDVVQGLATAARAAEDAPVDDLTVVAFRPGALPLAIRRERGDATVRIER